MEREGKVILERERERDAQKSYIFKDIFDVHLFNFSEFVVYALFYELFAGFITLT